MLSPENPTAKPCPDLKGDTMKYRIKQITKKDGSITFHPQVGLFGYYIDLKGANQFSSLVMAEAKIRAKFRVNTQYIGASYKYHRFEK